MKNLITKLIFLTLFPAISWSQEFMVKGAIQGVDKNPIPYANVLLLKIIDSSLVKGTVTTEKGLFELTSIKKGKYFLSISYVGNQLSYKRVEITSDVNMGALIFDQEVNELNEVVVTKQKPKLERKIDRLVFNITNTALSDGDIWEVLKQTPSVIVSQNQLSVKGNTNIGVMINGKKVNLPQEDIVNLLSGTSASNVEAIEVITNPPAKYSAEDGVLLNIKMSKNLISGYNGAIFNRYGQGVFPKHTLGSDHYFRSKKMSFSVNYGFTKNKDITRYTDITSFFENNMAASIWTAEQARVTRRQKHNISTFLDYKIDKKNTVSLSSITVYNPSVNRFYDTKTLIHDFNQQPLSSFNTINNSGQSNLNSSVYLDWSHKFRKKGTGLSTNAHFTYYDSDRGQALETDFFDIDGIITGENNFMTQSLQRINLYSLQTDYNTTLGKSTTVEAGLRYAGIDSKSTISQEGFDRNQPGIEPTEAGIFKYDESIYAAYTSFNSKWSKWKFKGGLRVEHTETIGDLDIAPIKKKNSYLEFFPSFSLNYRSSEKHNYILYYYRRINRPRYNSINPFQYFQSNNSVIEGNPDLLPATRNYVALGYTYNRNYTIEFFYKNQKNLNQLQVFQDNDANLLRFVNRNLIKDISYGTDLSMSKNFTSYWDVYLLVYCYYREDSFADLDSGQVLQNGLWTWFFRANNSFSLLKDKSLMINLDFLYYSPIVSGNATQNSYSRTGFNIRKSLLHKKISISMGISDIFNQGNLFNTRRFLDQNNSSSYRPENRLFTFGFRYKFGNQGIKSNKKSKRINERNRI